ncbi:MAG TPA: hypothetical protein VFH03_22470 [Actinoplanes sp.]|nr:hypothetical protein [Actinoplanes sp.]
MANDAGIVDELVAAAGSGRSPAGPIWAPTGGRLTVLASLRWWWALSHWLEHFDA